MTETTFRYDQPEGPMYVEILAGRENNHTGQHEGFVRVRTNEGPNLITMRGRRYSIDRVWRRREGGWQFDSQVYGGKGFRNDDTGKQVDYKSTVHDKLSEIEDRVLAAFLDDVPDWETMSRRMWLANQLRRAEAAVTSAVAERDRIRQEIDKLDQEA